MTAVLETIGVVAVGGIIYKLYKQLRGDLEPSEEAMKDVKKCEKLLNGLTYNQNNETFMCEAFEEIAEEEFGAFVDEFAEIRKLSDKTKASLLQILHMKTQQGCTSYFTFENGEGKMYFEQIIAMRNNGKINLAMAKYELSFELTAMLEEWYLFGFIPIKSKVYADANTLTMTEHQKEVFRNMCRAKLYSHVNEKCRNFEIER